MDQLEIAKALAAVPLTVILVLVLVGGYKEWWIYGGLHRTRVAELHEQVEDERARADKWETRFLELDQKLETIGKAVNGTASAAEAKLDVLEHEIAILRKALQDKRTAAAVVVLPTEPRA